MLMLGRGFAGQRFSRCLDAAADNRGLGDLWRFLLRLNGMAWVSDLAGFGSQGDGLFPGCLSFGLGLFVHLGASLILCKIQIGDDLVLSFFRSRQLFLMLEWLLALRLQLLNTCLEPTEILIGLGMPRLQIAEGVFHRGDGALRTVADGGLVGVSAVDAKFNTGFEPMERNGKPGDGTDLACFLHGLEGGPDKNQLATGLDALIEVLAVNRHREFFAACRSASGEV